MCIFSYFLLCDLRYEEIISNQDLNNQSVIQNFEKTKRLPGVFEYILSVWILTLTIEEIRQVRDLMFVFFFQFYSDSSPPIMKAKEFKNKYVQV